MEFSGDVNQFVDMSDVNQFVDMLNFIGFQPIRRCSASTRFILYYEPTTIYWPTANTAQCSLRNTAYANLASSYQCSM